MKIKEITKISVLGILVINACNKEEKVVSPTIANEALTTVQLKLTNSEDPADTAYAQWEQLLDNNGNPLPVDVSKAILNIKANTTYTAKLILLDKTQTPVFVVSNEIKERANYHLFFYQPLPATGDMIIPAPVGSDVYPSPIPTPLPQGVSPLHLTVSITDMDSNPSPLPVGLETEFVTGNSGSGWLRIVLRHQPNVKDGTYAPGSTDMDAGFEVNIQ